MTDKMAGDIFKSDPRKVKTEPTKEEEYIRKTFMVKNKYSDLINRKAYWERREIKDVLNEILKDYFKNKKIKEYPS